ncbi:hypothetical protein K474DRAFT_1597625 [Panus rudis PR-1116 ss-1]|nr:hypothetical protein K474DRAFT_1597625 [Panus rudis PR-1116 ss-1]
MSFRALSRLSSICRQTPSNLTFSKVPRGAFRHLSTQPSLYSTKYTSTLRSQARFFSSSRPHNNRPRYVRFGVDTQHPLNVNKWDKGTKILVGIFAFGTVYYVSHLEQVPETGRWRFMDINPKFESQLAEVAHEQLVLEFRGKILPPNHPITRHVRRVVIQILDANNLGTLKSSAPQRKVHPVSESEVLWNPDGSESGRTEEVVPGVGGREWELMVVHDDKVVNAMASYGNIVVFTGILPVAKDENGLAAILGHEIGHVVARHNSERYSNTKILLAFVSLLAVIGIDFGISNFISRLLIDLPNSRTQEYEADVIGLKLMSKACFDPRAAPTMFQRLSQVEKAQGGGWNVDFIHTHPSSDKRVQKLQEMLPEAYALRAASPECSAVQDHLQAFGDALTSGFGPVMPRWL